MQVDDLFNVQVCDFGLSRFKANTCIPSKSVAGTVKILPRVSHSANLIVSISCYNFQFIL